MGESGHSPALVGKHFIMNYYTILHDEPQSLYKFYKDDSVYSFGVEGEPLSPESTVTGQSSINEKIASLGFRECKVHLSVVDAQPTLAGGVLLMVKGTITNGGASRKFIQTFLLAQQPSGYYVRNDILRYVADEATKPDDLGQAIHTRTGVTADKAKEAPIELKEPVAEPAATAAPETTQADTTAQEPEPQAEVEVAPKPVAEETPKEVPVSAAPVAATTPVSAVTPVAAVVPVTAIPPPVATSPSTTPAGKVSSGNVRSARSSHGRGKSRDKEDKHRAHTAASTAGTASPTAAPEASSSTSTSAPSPAGASKEPTPADNSSWAAMAARKKDVPVTPLSRTAQPLQAKKPSTPSVSPTVAPGTTSSEEGTASPATVQMENATAERAAEEKPVSDPHSIYVSNLPFAAKRNQVIEAFKGFGTITFCSMQSEKGYAFIEYESSESAQSAIKAAAESPISMDGRVLRVEERKTKRSGATGGRKPQGGRGSGERPTRGPRPDGKERPVGSPRPNGSDKRDRKERGEKRAPAGTGSPSAGQGRGAAGTRSGGVAAGKK